MNRPGSDVRYAVDAEKAQWRIVDDEAVIVNVESSYYYGMNRTGTLVWSLLTASALTLDELTAHVAETYDIELDHARGDVASVIGHLIDEGLVKEV